MRRQGCATQRQNHMSGPSPGLSAGLEEATCRSNLVILKEVRMESYGEELAAV